MEPFTLYHYWRSSSSWRVRWALLEKGLAFEPVAVNLLGGEHRNDAYRARSPLAFVPALVIGEMTITESVAICEYLDEVYPEPPIRPAAPAQRARMRQMVEMINAGTQPLQNLLVMQKVSGAKEEQQAWSRFFIERGLSAFEKLIELTRQEGVSGPFCLGAHLTMADFYLVPQLYNARRFDVDLTPFARCLEIEANALATESGRASHPDRYQPA